jgi:hypothetical protein
MRTPGPPGSCDQRSVLYSLPCGTGAGAAGIPGDLPAGTRCRGAGGRPRATASPRPCPAFNGDLDRLRALIEDEDADEIVRVDAFDALTYLTATGALPRETAAAYLRDLHGKMQPQSMSFVWYGWQKSIALLGLDELKPLVAAAFERGLIDPTVTDYNLFLEDLRSARSTSARRRDVPPASAHPPSGMRCSPW